MRSEQPQVRHLRLRFDPGESDGNTLVGLAVPFNTITRIHEWGTTFDEQFAPGAFKRTLQHKTPVLQFDHGTHPMLGSIPIGEFRSIKETKRGLEVEAEIFDNWMTLPLRDAIRAGSIDGMSIRFRPLQLEITEPEARTDGGDVDLQTVTESELMELGPVVFPAYPTTEVDLRTLDLGSEIDRRRLAEALLAGVVPTRDDSGDLDEPGTTPQEAGVPADTADPDKLHSVRSPQIQRLEELKEFEQRWLTSRS